MNTVQDQDEMDSDWIVCPCITCIRLSLGNGNNYYIVDINGHVNQRLYFEFINILPAGRATVAPAFKDIACRLLSFR